MFNPEFDPLQQLEQLQHDASVLKMNMVELARAFNHQVDFTQQLTQQIASQNAWIEKQRRQIDDLNKRLQEIENNGW